MNISGSLSVQKHAYNYSSFILQAMVMVMGGDE